MLSLVAVRNMYSDAAGVTAMITDSTRVAQRLEGNHVQYATLAARGTPFGIATGVM